MAVFGASGFVGRYVVRELARSGARIRAVVRRPDRAGFLRPMGDVGQITPLAANIRDDASVVAAVRWRGYGHQSGRYSGTPGAPVLSGSPCRRGATGCGGRSRCRCQDARSRVSHRCRSGLRCRICCHERTWRKPRARDLCRGHCGETQPGDRSGGRLLQPICGPGAAPSGPAPSRLGPYEIFSRSMSVMWVQPLRSWHNTPNMRAGFSSSAAPRSSPTVNSWKSC